jgi:hypothetical protein
MRTLLRNLLSLSFVVAVVAGLVLPAQADTLSGTFKITTKTGKHMIVTIIESGDNIVGYYVGNGGVAGRITGSYDASLSKSTGKTSYTYTWVEKAGDGTNDTTKSGWGNMTFSDDGTSMNTSWGYDNQSGGAVGFWSATLIPT